MAYSKRELDDIYHKTDGYCHLCGRKVYRTNYGKLGRRGPWHVEHSVPKSRGGTSYFRNLFPACIDCNLDKGTRTGKSYRASIERTSDKGLDLGNLVVIGIGALVLSALLSRDGTGPAMPPSGPH